MEKSGKIKLDIPSLLNSLGKSLYKDQTVVMRELLQNAHDAISFYRRSLLETGNYAFTPEVSVTFYRSKNELSVKDNGIGMSEYELEEEFAKVGGSPKKEALQRIIDSRGGFGERIIGQYGIGFLSAFLVADRVDVFSKKEDEKSYHWWCGGDANYYIEEYEVDFERGTEVRLKLKDDIPKDFESVEGIKSLCAKFGFLLQVPIFVQNTLINRFSRNWSSPNEFMNIPDSLMKDFLREKFPVEFIDIFKVNHTAEHITHGDVSFRAALFIGEVGAEVKLFKGTPFESAATGIDIYVKGMFVCRTIEFSPSWASYVNGVIDFDNLDLSLSREEVKENNLYKKYKEIVEAKITERLREIKGTDKLQRIVDRHRAELLQGLAILGDRKVIGKGQTLLEELIEFIPFETSHGRAFLPNYIQSVNDASKKFRNCEENSIYCVSQKTSGASESILAEDMGWPVIFTIPIEEKVIEDFVGLNSEYQKKVMTPDDFFVEKQEEEDNLIEILFQQQMNRLNVPKLNYQVRHFRESVPAMLLIEGSGDKDASKFFKMLEHASNDKDLEGNEMLEIMQKLAERYQHDNSSKTLYINGRNSIIKSLVKIYRADPTDESLLLASRAIYHSAFLQSARGSLTPRDTEIIIENFNETLGKVISLTLQVKSPEYIKRQYEEAHVIDEEGELIEPYIFCVHSFSSKSVLAAINKLKVTIPNLLNIQALSASDEVQALTVPENVKTMIRQCKFGVADITGNNPNVMLEIGMLEMLGKPVVKIRDANDDVKIPIDIGGDLYCTYNSWKTNRDEWKVDADFTENVRNFILKANSIIESKRK